jgi:hypothetical protein
MTEQEWLVSNSIEPMLNLIGRRNYRRQRRLLRLFACACARRVWYWLTDSRSFRAITVAERHADQGASDAELQAAHQDAQLAREIAARHVAVGQVDHAISRVVGDTLWLSIHPAWERAQQAHLLRHLFGNPFRPVERPSYLPPTVVALAQSVYRGDVQAVGPLHDALIEAGRTEWASHFDAPEHPKGCWVLDLLQLTPAEAENERRNDSTAIGR